DLYLLSSRSAYFATFRYQLMILFFFQAEDGIRYKLVTGVQTCALPILRGARARNLPADSHLCRAIRSRPTAGPRGRASHQGVDRSEERRVGKEFRFWLSS